MKYAHHSPDAQRGSITVTVALASIAVLVLVTSLVLGIQAFIYKRALYHNADMLALSVASVGYAQEINACSTTDTVVRILDINAEVVECHHGIENSSERYREYYTLELRKEVSGLAVPITLKGKATAGWQWSRDIPGV